MKRLILGGILALALPISAPPTAHAQGTTYFSNLGATTAGSLAVAGDSWMAAEFSAGTNSGGYLLNSIQLALGDASGAPAGFSVMLYTDVGAAGPYPGTSLGTLSGSANPSMAGIYTFTPTGDLLLSARTAYFIVLTGGTPATQGAYQWDYASTWSYNRIDRWNGTYGYGSIDGSSWSQSGLPVSFPIFGITATPAPEVPEPSVIGLLVLGGLSLARSKTLSLGRRKTLR